jgi:ribosomal protein L17
MAHAVLSASGSHRWLNCSPSARLEQSFADSESEAAAEGTAAHALCEHKLKRALKFRSKKPVSRFDCDEMDVYTDDYVSFVMETLTVAKQRCKDPIVLIEQHLDFSCYVPEGFGTGDAIIVGDGILHVIDFKYGQGMLVNASDNPQMKLYALGALELFSNLYDIDEVSMTIYQPRRENVSTWTISVPDIKDWAEEFLIPHAALAYKGEGEYCPGEWCHFCKAAVKCRARAEAKLQLAAYEFALPPLLSDDEIEEILSKLNDISKWADEILSYAADSAINHGKQWVGYKIVEGRSVRKYTDESAVANAAKAAGYTDIYKQSLITLTEMEALLGKKKFIEILGVLITKPPGKLTLVPDTDKRPPVTISNVHDDFKEDI